MIRLLGLVSIACACASCRPAATAVPPEPALPPAPAPEQAQDPATPLSQSEILEAHHHAAVDIDDHVDVPEGEVIVYSYGRLEARIGELSGSGRDVEAELAAEERTCNEERAALDPDEREWIEQDYESCEALAGARLFGDEQLMPSCLAWGFALFDREDNLLELHEFDDYGGPCLTGLTVFAAHDLSPAPTDDLVLVADFETLGELTRGGWGSTSDASHLYVLAVETDGKGKPFLFERFDVELRHSYDGGNCDRGTDRRVRLAADGAFEVFEQPWDSCAGEGCIDPDDADEDTDPEALCEKLVIGAERAAWDPENGTWEPLEPMSHHETELPPNFWDDWPQ